MTNCALSSQVPDPAKRDELIDRLTLRPHTRQNGPTSSVIFSRVRQIASATKERTSFISWIYDNIHLDRPYNLMVQDMITANAASNWYVGPSGYVARWVVIGIKCEDTVHEDTSDELAINSVKHFLGVDLNCVSCHDGRNHLEKINLWLAARKRDELYGMGAFFGKTRVLRRVEVATTQDEYSIDDSGPGYDASARTVVRVPRRGPARVSRSRLHVHRGACRTLAKNPRAEFARMLTSHPQFARTAVNLLWAEMFGVGIVDPPLDFDLARMDPAKPPPGPWTMQPTHPELLDALAAISANTTTACGKC